MAWSVSGLYVANWIDIVDASQLAVDLTQTTNGKTALYDNSNTPNYSSDVSYSATNEITNTSGSGYTAKGAAAASPTITESPTGSLMFDQADTAWTVSTFGPAYGAKYYNDQLASDNLVVGVYFGSGYSVTAGTFTIQWAAAGVFAIDLTP